MEDFSVPLDIHVDPKESDEWAHELSGSAFMQLALNYAPELFSRENLKNWINKGLKEKIIKEKNGVLLGNLSHG